LTLHELKLRLQDHFSDGLVTVVGSGLSCAEGLPGMAELAEHLQKVFEDGLMPTDADLWARLAPIVAAKGLEAALLEIEPSQTLEAAIVSHTCDLIASREREIVSQVFSRTKILRFTRLLPHLLIPATGGLSVVTTNYDRLIEIAAEEAGRGVDTMFVGHFAGVLNEKESSMSFLRDISIIRGKRVHREYQPRVNVFKPHGSLDWYHRDGNPVRYSGDLPLPRLIITPGLNRQAQRSSKFSPRPCCSHSDHRIWLQ
jgi:hypothetical protein